MTDDPRAHIAIRVHDTPSVIYNTLAQVFPEQSGATSRWVKIIDTDGVEIIFFALTEKVDTNA